MRAIQTSCWGDKRREMVVLAQQQKKKKSKNNKCKDKFEQHKIHIIKSEGKGAREKDRIKLKTLIEK